jgi:hypothetical protein
MLAPSELLRSPRQRKVDPMAQLSRYRVLNAILALREFTVADLARYSGVKDTTVRTVLGRDSRYIERAGTQTRGRRGGQPIQYRLQPGAEDSLVAILRELEGFGANLPPLVADEEDPTMLSLIAAEDVLIRQLPRACTGDRAGLVSLAAADYAAAQFPGRPEHEEAVAHRGVVDVLLRLAEVEQEALTHDSPNGETRSADWSAAELSDESMKKLVALGRDLRRLLSCWPVLSDRGLLPDLIHRVGTSRFGPVILRSGGEAPVRAGA